eukprot:4012683-Amphidinium_carterae.1
MHEERPTILKTYLMMCTLVDASEPQIAGAGGQASRERLDPRTCRLVRAEETGSETGHGAFIMPSCSRTNERAGARSIRNKF